MKISDIQRYDSKKMYESYDNWAEVAQKNYNKDLPKIQFKNIDHIVFAGVGGSGTVGDVISSIQSKKNIHTNVVKGYLLPNQHANKLQSEKKSLLQKLHILASLYFDL